MAIELPDGRCASNEVLGALRLRAVHARELGYLVAAVKARHAGLEGRPVHRTRPPPLLRHAAVHRVARPC